MIKMNKAIVLHIILAAVLLAACEQPHTKRQDTPADSLINSAYQVHNYDSIVAVANRCQQEGTLSDLKAYYWRGYAYSRQHKMRMAEMEWKNATAQSVKTDEDLDYYAQSANRLVGLLYQETEYGEAIQVAQKTIDLLREKHHTANNDQGRQLPGVRDGNNWSEQWFTMVHITFILIIIGFCLFIYFHKRAASRLEASYKHLERVNVRAEESSRMKSDFIQQISHEIRTPLNILSGFTQLITTPGAEYDEATLSDMRRQITVNTDRIAGLVNKMLELSEAKNQSARERNDKVSALQIAAEAINASGISDAGHLTFDMKATPEAEQATLQTNLQAAVRALTLILDNARKFTAPAEFIQHEKNNDHQQKVVLRMTVAAKRLFFSVEDTGIGIPHKDAERIFDEFVQLDEYYDGTGIGLTVARSLARSIGGDIILDTAYIGGSRFVMTLPIYNSIND